MDARRLDAKFAESATLLAQLYTEAKRSVRRCQETARDSVWRDVCAFLDAAARERGALTLADFEHFVDFMLSQGEESGERLRCHEPFPSLVSEKQL